MRSAFAGLVLIAGCDALWGIDHVGPYSPPVDGSDPAFDHGIVHGRYVQRWVQNLPDSASPDPHELELTASQLTADVTLDDGSHRTVAIDDTGFSFTTPEPDDHYAIRFTTPFGPRTWVARSATLQLVERLHYRPDRELASPGTRLTLNISNRTHMPTEELVTTGSWSRTNVNDTAVSVDASTTDQYGTQIGILTPHDAAYYTLTEPVDDYFHMVRTAKVPDVIMMKGIDNTYPPSGMFAATTLTTNKCVQVQARGTDEAARITASYPDVNATLPVWFVDLDPSLELGLTIQLPVAEGAADGVVRDVAYGNPYGLHQIDVLLAVAAATVHGAIIQTLLLVPAKGDCSVLTELAAGQVEIPTSIRLAGTLLDTMGQVITLPHAGFADVTWEPSALGNASYYIVSLEQLAGAGVITAEQIVTTERRARIPAGAFTTSSSYQLRVIAVIGFPNAGGGDFLSVAAPIGTGNVQTSSFRSQ